MNKQKQLSHRTVAVALLVMLLGLVGQPSLAAAGSPGPQSPDQPKRSDQQRMALPQGVPFAVVGLKTYAADQDQQWVGIRFGDELATHLARFSHYFTQVERLHLHQVMKSQGLSQAAIDGKDSASVDQVRRMLSSPAGGPGRMVGAHWLIVGSVTVQDGADSANNLMVNVRLDKVDTGEVLGGWSTTGSVDQLDALIGESAVEMARAMGARLNAEEETKLRQRGSLSGLAREAYDRANVAFDRGDYQTAQKEYWHSWQLSAYRFHEAISRYGDCWKLLPQSAALAIEQMEDQFQLIRQASGSIGLVLAQLYFADKSEQKLTRPKALKYLSAALEDGIETVRRRALQLVTVHRLDELAEEAAEALQDPSRAVRLEALNALQSLKNPRTADALIRFMETEQDAGLVAGAGYRLSEFPPDAQISQRMKAMLDGLSGEDADSLRQRTTLLLCGAYYFLKTDGDYALALARDAVACLQRWETLAAGATGEALQIGHGDKANVYWCMAFCFEQQETPDLEQALAWYQKAASEEEAGLLAGEVRAGILAGTYANLARCMAQKAEPDWNTLQDWSRKAIAEYQKALKDGTAKHGDLGWSHYQLGWALHNRPQPDWAAAINQYQQAETELQKGLEDGSASQQDLGHIYKWLGWCLHNQAQPAWAEAMENYRQAAAAYALGLADGSAQNGDLGWVYFQLGWSSQNQPEPDWSVAIDWYQKAEAAYRLAVADGSAQQTALGQTYEALSLCFAKESSAKDEESSAHYAGLGLREYLRAFLRDRANLTSALDKGSAESQTAAQTAAPRQAEGKSATEAARTSDAPAQAKAPETPQPAKPPLTDEIVRANLPMIQAIAASVAKSGKLPPGITYNDLIKFGYEGFIKAYYNYDTNSKTGFHIYAAYRVRGAILDRLRQEWKARNPVSYQKMQEKMQEKINEVVYQAIDSNSTLNAATIDERKKRAAAIVANSAVIYLLSLDTADLLSKDAQALASDEFLKERGVLWGAVNELLSKKEKDFAYLFYIKEKNQAEAAKILGITKRECALMHIGLLDKLRARLIQSLGDKWWENLKAKIERNERIRPKE
jgi:RNA polymerase sigma factor for flagellar operon FliA